MACNPQILRLLEIIFTIFVDISRHPLTSVGAVVYYGRMKNTKDNRGGEKERAMGRTREEVLRSLTELHALGSSVALLGGRKARLVHAIIDLRGIAMEDVNYIPTLKRLRRKTSDQLWALIRVETSKG